MLLARLDAGSRSLIDSGAGHLPGYLPDESGAVRAPLKGASTPLGIMDDREFPQALPVTMQPGDLVFLYIDGVIEATATDGSLFGIERALEVIRSARVEPARNIVQALEEANRRFARTERSHDDFTAIVIKVE